MESDYVLLYRDERFNPENQHPSYKNRVDLQDRQMKDGDVSLILKNVTINDNGTYQCHVVLQVRGPMTMTLINSTNLVVVPPGQETIKAESGQDVTLPCRAPKNSSSIIAVEWSRADLGDEYVLLYRDELFDPDGQHPSFKNRVDLKDRQMKDGDVSLILKDVTTADSGTYECSVNMKTNHRKRANLDNNNIISIISLSVDPPGGLVGVIVGLSITAVLLVAAVVGFLVHRQRKQQQSQDSYQPPVEL